MNYFILIILALHSGFMLGGTRLEVSNSSPYAMCLDVREGDRPELDLLPCHRGGSQSFLLREVASRAYLEDPFLGYLGWDDGLEYSFTLGDGLGRLFMDKVCHSLSLEIAEGVFDAVFQSDGPLASQIDWRKRQDNECAIASTLVAKGFDNGEEEATQPLVEQFFARLAALEEWRARPGLSAAIPADSVSKVKKIFVGSDSYPGASELRLAIAEIGRLAPVMTLSQGTKCVTAEAAVEGASVSLWRCRESATQLWRYRVDGKLQLYGTDYCLNNLFQAVQLNHCEVAEKAVWQGRNLGLNAIGATLWLTAVDGDLRFDYPFLNEGLQEWIPNYLESDTLDVIRAHSDYTSDWLSLEKTYNFLRVSFQEDGSYEHLTKVIRDDLQGLEAFYQSASFAHPLFGAELRHQMRRRRLIRYQGKLREPSTGLCFATTRRHQRPTRGSCEEMGNLFTLDVFGHEEGFGQMTRSIGPSIAFQPGVHEFYNGKLLWRPEVSGIGSSKGGRFFDNLVGMNPTIATKISKLFVAHQRSGDYLHWLGMEREGSRFFYGKGGSAHQTVLTFDKEEFLVALEVCEGTRYKNRWRVFGIRPITVKNGEVKRYPLFGKRTDHCAGRVIAHPADRPEQGLYKHHIIGLFGRHGDDLDQLGAHFGLL